MSFRESQSVSYCNNNNNNANATNGSVTESGQVKRVWLQRKSKEKNEKDSNEDSPQAPDSTTEPPKPAHDFQEGDDVFFQNEEGQNILGTIGQVTPLRCQIHFGDGTEQWAPFKRIKKLSSAFTEPSTSFHENRGSESKKKIKTELICLTCKGSKKVSSRKAVSYNTADTPFTCAKCTAAKVVPVPALSKVVANLNEYQRNKVNPRQIIRRTSSGSHAPINNVVNNRSPVVSSGPKMDSRPKLIPYIPSQGQGSSKFPAAGNLPPRLPNHTNLDYSPLTMKPMKTSVSVELKTSPAKSGTKSNLCFHCGERTVPYNRVHCNMCERYCHLMCLQLGSIPLDGDKFWDVMCSACGTQNGSKEEELNRVFSVRRSINSWSDVVHLIINCLKVKSMGQQYFDFESQIIPFFDTNKDKLHLPSKYKSPLPEDLRSNLLAALKGSRMFFTKRKPEKVPTNSSSSGSLSEKTLWALRSDKSTESSPEGTNTTATPQLRIPNRNLMVSPINKSPDANKSSPEISSEVDSSPPPVPKASLPPPLKNRIGSGNSSSLSVFSIPGPYVSKTGPTSNNNSSNINNDNSNSNTSSTLSYPRVLSKEIVLRNPITTNIVLAPTNSTIATTAGFNNNNTKGISPSPRSASLKGTNVQTPQKEDSNRRQRLRIRLPLKPPSSSSKDSTKGKEKKLQQPPPSLSPARPDLSTPKKAKYPPGTTTTPEGPRRKRLLSSGEDSDKDPPLTPAPKQSKTLPLSPTMPQLTKQDHPPPPGINPPPLQIKSPQPISSTVAREAIGHPSVPSLRLTLTRGRPKLLRSSVLNNAKNLRGKASVGRGRGGRSSGSTSVSRLLPPKESSNSSQNSNDSSSRSSSLLTNGIWKGDPKVSSSSAQVSSSNGNSNGLRIKKVPWAPTGSGLPLEKEEEEEDPSKIFYDNLISAALTGLRVQCLPKPLDQENAKRTVAELYSEENINSEEQENLKEIQNSKGKKNRFGKSLEDTDSYEVVASKIGPDGVKKYLVVWKEPVDVKGLDFDEEVERLFRKSPLGSIKPDPNLMQMFNGSRIRIKSESDLKNQKKRVKLEHQHQLQQPKLKRMLEEDDDIKILKHSPAKSSSSSSGSSIKNHNKYAVTCFIDLTDSS